MGTSCRGCLTRGWPLAAAAAPGTWPPRGAGCSAGTPAAAGSRSGPGLRSGLAGRPHAIAARGHLLAAATGEAVYLWRREGEQLAAVIPGRVTALAIAPWGEILLVRDGSVDVSRYDLAGSWRGRIVTGMTGRVEALTTGRALTARRPLHHLGADR